MTPLSLRHFQIYEPILISMMKADMFKGETCKRELKNENDVPNTVETVWRDVTINGKKFELISVITTTWPSDRLQDIKIRLQYEGRSHDRNCIYWQLRLTNWPKMGMYRIGDSTLFSRVEKAPLGVKNMMIEAAPSMFPEPESKAEPAPAVVFNVSF